jgi:hypothetical protein
MGGLDQPRKVVVTYIPTERLLVLVEILPPYPAARDIEMCGFINVWLTYLYVGAFIIKGRRLFRNISIDGLVIVH